MSVPGSRLAAIEGGIVDNVERWQRLLPAYPDASFSFQPPFFYGALRDDDLPIRTTDLGRLIDALLTRESQEGE